LNGSQAPGTVLAQAPLPGQQLRGGAAVTLAISGGVASVRVPPLRGMIQLDAVALLDSLGLATASARDLSPLPVGQVVQSTPEAGTPVARGDTIHLTVSEGPPLMPAPVPGLDTTPQPVGPGAGGPGEEGQGS
jgi:beta-lactam-binding protein with PASTA domain